MSQPSEAQITFRLPRKLADRLSRLARRTGLRRSELVRRATEAYVDVAESTSARRPYDRVRHLIGSVRSGIPDLAERHSEYLKRILRDGR